MIVTLKLWLLRTAHLMMRKSTARDPIAADPPTFATFDRSVYTELADAIGGDDVRMVTGQFLSDTAQRLDVMRRAAATGDRETIKLGAHTTKGSAGILGFFRLSSLAELLEHDVPSLDRPALNARLDAIDGEFAKIKAIVGGMRPTVAATAE